MIRIRRRGRFAAAVVIGFVAAGLVALTATGAVRVLGLPTYTGPESKYPKTYPTPTKKPVMRPMSMERVTKASGIHMTAMSITSAARRRHQSATGMPVVSGAA